MASDWDRVFRSIDLPDEELGLDVDDVLEGGRLELIESADPVAVDSIRLAELIERMSEPRSAAGLDHIARLIAEALAEASLEPRLTIR